MSYVYLSYRMSRSDPRPPAIPSPQIDDFMTVKNDGASVSCVTFYNHTGSHLDTAAHVFEDGISIEDFTLDDLIFHDICTVSFELTDGYHITEKDFIPYADKIKDCDMLIVKFGVERIRAEEKERFSNKMPGFTCEAAGWLKENFKKLRCIGTDVPSFGVISDLENTMQAHNVFLEVIMQFYFEENESGTLIIDALRF